MAAVGDGGGGDDDDARVLEAMAMKSMEKRRMTFRVSFAFGLMPLRVQDGSMEEDGRLKFNNIKLR